MESNSSKNSHGRDYWGNQQVSERKRGKVRWTFTYCHFRLRHRVRRLVARTKRHHQVTRDEARRLLKALQVAQKEFHKTLATSSGRMEAQRRRISRRMQCLREVGLLMFQRCHDRTNWRFQAERRPLRQTSSRVDNFNLSGLRMINDETLFALLEMQQQNAQYRSFSLTGPGAAQLSQSVKERFGSGTHSLPKGALDMHVFQHRFVIHFSPHFIS